MDWWDIEDLREQAEHEKWMQLGRTWATKLSHRFTWTDSNDVRHQIRSMTDDHRQNVIRYLRRNATRIKQYVDYTAAESRHFAYPGADDETDAYTWMTGTPLFTELVLAAYNQTPGERSRQRSIREGS